MFSEKPEKCSSTAMLPLLLRETEAVEGCRDPEILLSMHTPLADLSFPVPVLATSF